jgi:RHS repeat-associated protein
VFIEERNNTWNTPYLFNAKELDEETGLYYYGARYYDPRISLWYGIDPLQEKYPDISTYAYCANNPVKYVDPDGREIWILFDETVDGKTVRQKVQYSNGKLYGTNGEEYTGSNEYATKVLNDLTKLSAGDDVLKGRINDLVGSKNIHTIEMTAKATDGNSNTPLSQSDDENGIPTGTTTKYNPNNNKNVRGDKREARVGLSHELLGHGWDSDKGKTDHSKTENGIPMYEVDAVNIENRARASAGNEKKTTYGGKSIPANLLHDTHKEK